VAEVVHRFEPNLPVTHVMTMDNVISDSVSPRRFSSLLVASFAGLALLLAAVGIYGVTSYTVSQRTQEIGLRMALGAQTHAVRGMILGETLKPHRRDRRPGGLVSSGAVCREPAASA
jgi:ABC-type antimicrobial peptide transport system permease subunit